MQLWKKMSLTVLKWQTVHSDDLYMYTFAYLWLMRSLFVVLSVAVFIIAALA